MTPPTDATASRRAWGLLFVRLVLGLIFARAGWFKVFEMGPMVHAEQLFLPYAETTFLPAWSLWTMGALIPVVELAAGVLLLGGWRVFEAGLALGAVLVVVTFGHLLTEPLYAFNSHVIPRLMLLAVLLLAPVGWDRFTLDRLLAQRGR
ncbi:MAG: MauE/DoxX family redox-associated membrane protein [Bacteroidota bacterium]